MNRRPAEKPAPKPTPEAADIVVFITRHAGECAECGAAIYDGSFITVPPKPAPQPLCLDCSDLDHLVFIPRGDAALTRRSGKYSRLSAVVVKWSRARKRYERQGILAEEAALARAESECLDDAEHRARRAERLREREARIDQAHAAAFAKRIKEEFPGCPPDEALAIAKHACLRSSGRIGRTAAAKELDHQAVTLAVIAAIRHSHTPYDSLLLSGVPREIARNRVAPEIHTRLDAWRSARHPKP